MEHGNWKNEKKAGGMAKALNAGGAAASLAGNFIPGKYLLTHIMFILNSLTHFEKLPSLVSPRIFVVATLLIMSRWGPSIKDVNKKFGIMDPLPGPHLEQISGTKSTQPPLLCLFLSQPPSPLHADIADVLYEWSLVSL